MTRGPDALVRLARSFTIRDGRRFDLRRIRPADTHGFDDLSKDDARLLLTQAVEAIARQQELLYAQDRWSVLLIFQAMDAAGKDSAIKHVLSGVNPQGVQVFSFKAPSAEELDHDYLWRTSVRLPERGRIGVFNRSYYEEVLAVRVRPELLAAQRLPSPLVTPRIWKERLEDIGAHERHLARNGYVMRKFFLHVSPEEQAERFLARLDNPAKRWKFSAADLEDRRRWPAYMRAYEETIRQTSAPHAPWLAVPADRKWFARLVIAGAVLDALRTLKLTPPTLSAAGSRQLSTARRSLEAAAGRAGRRAPR